MSADKLDVLLSADEIAKRTRELGAEITRDFSGKELHVIGVLKGSFLFMADLIREINLTMTLDFLGTSSYGNETETSGVVNIVKDLSQQIAGKDVLVVEDIVDTGLTLSYLLENLSTRHPRSLKLCTLLDKPSRRVKEVKVDYVGFTIPNKFVVGYGLDYAEKYRNVPFIGVVPTLEGKPLV